MHRLDARLKFVCALAIILGLTLLPVGAWAALALVFVGLMLAATVAGIGPTRLVRGAVVALPFLLVAVPVVFTQAGDTLGSLELGPLRLRVTGEGLRTFATVAAKSWLSVQVALLLTYTTPFHDLLDAMRELRVPRILVAIIGFMYRYLAVIGDEAQRLIRARAARSAAVEGARAGGSLRWRASVTGHMVGSLFLRSYERSERIYAAMIARGFDGTFRHLELRPIARAEWAAFTLTLAAVTALLVAAHLGPLRP